MSVYFSQSGCANQSDWRRNVVMPGIVDLYLIWICEIEKGTI